MSKVYLTQAQRGFNLSPATAFGEMVEVFPPGYQAYGDTKHYVAMAKEALKSFTGDDYLLLMGDPVMMSIVAAQALKVSGGKATVLKWDKRLNGGSYVPVKIDLGY